MKSGLLRIGRNVNTSPNIDIAGRLDEVANIFAEQRAQTGFGFRRIAKPRTCFAVCRVRWLIFSNAKESRDWRKSRVSVRVLPGRFATSFFMAGLRCSIVSAAKARRLPFLRRCLALEKNLRDVSMTISESKRWRSLKSQLMMDASKNIPVSVQND